MPTDIKLDEGDGNWLILESTVLRSTASDFILQAPSRMTRGSGGFRRALVHDGKDGLTINFNNDYPGGVTVESNLRVTGKLLLSSNENRDLLSLMREIQARIDQLEQNVSALATLMKAVVIPAWSTKEEVDNGDDMGILYMSAEDLGLQVEWEVYQNDPRYDDGEIIRITPPAGSVVPLGSTIHIAYNAAE